MRSNLLLICDDDNIPEKGYISRFAEKYRAYGPDAAICIRGHVFLPHSLDEDQPEQVWQQQEHMQFFDESTPDRRVHFMHADNCLLPKHILRRACIHQMENYEFGLVDDYWLSFILGHHLKVPVWKVQADDVVAFADSSEDPTIALYHNPKVAEQRVNFYVHHMRKGWPAF